MGSGQALAHRISCHPLRIYCLAVCLVSGLAMLPAFSILASPYIFLAITSVATIGLAFSYAAPILCRIAFARSHFQPGRFNLKR